MCARGRAHVGSIICSCLDIVRLLVTVTVTSLPLYADCVVVVVFLLPRALHYTHSPCLFGVRVCKKSGLSVEKLYCQQFIVGFAVVAFDSVVVVVIFCILVLSLLSLYTTRLRSDGASKARAIRTKLK